MPGYVTEKDYDKNYAIFALKERIENAEAIVIGGGAGLSTSAGFEYGGERFQEHFPGYTQRYGFKDEYSGGFYPYQKATEYWAFWARAIMANRYSPALNNLYEEVFELVKDKNYFVLTTNVDHQFQKAGFNKQRLFYTQGDYGLFQCNIPCHNKTYDNEAQVREMFDSLRGFEIPEELIPICPVCGHQMNLNLRCDDSFVEDEGWHEHAKLYEQFIVKNSRKRILFLELGVGFNTPGIIKYPFWKMTKANPDAFYACINYGQALAPSEIRNQSVCFNADIKEIVEAML